MLPDFENIQDEEQAQTSNFNERYLERFVQLQELRIQTRKILEEFLLTVSCQTASASLAIILFQYAVQVYFALFLCLVVSWIPLIVNLAEADIEQTKTSEGYSIAIMSKGLRILIKFALGVGITSLTIHSVYKEIIHAEQQIREVYAEIRRFEQHPRITDFLPPYTGIILLASVAIVTVAMLFNKRNTF